MSKYIEVDKLIAEIERWRDKAKEKYNESTYSMGRCDALAEFRNHIVSLQQEQPEVDLEKEANECWNYVFSAIGWDENSLMTMNHKEFLAFARHFYELDRAGKKE